MCAIDHLSVGDLLICGLSAMPVRSARLYCYLCVTHGTLIHLNEYVIWHNNIAAI